MSQRVYLSVPRLGSHRSDGVPPGREGLSHCADEVARRSHVSAPRRGFVRGSYIAPARRANRKFAANRADRCRQTLALVADDSSAQAQRASPQSPGWSGLLAAVRRFRMVDNTTGSCVASDSGRASYQTGAEGYTTMVEWRLREKNMPSLEMDRLATEAMQCWADFQEGLSSDKQKYPCNSFELFGRSQNATPS
ncbi:MAG: hypothetical protein QOJ41_3022 [Acidobacteriaceae bacterium]|jgi:hypothetical protein|nr:hypothetical protein [Acidobacteriaceae bacterium]